MVASTIWRWFSMDQWLLFWLARPSSRHPHGSFPSRPTGCLCDSPASHTDWLLAIHKCTCIYTHTFWWCACVSAWAVTLFICTTGYSLQLWLPRQCPHANYSVRVCPCLVSWLPHPLVPFPHTTGKHDGSYMYASARCVVLQCPVSVYALYPFMMCCFN